MFFVDKFCKWLNSVSYNTDEEIMGTNFVKNLKLRVSHLENKFNGNYFRPPDEILEVGGPKLRGLEEF